MTSLPATAADIAPAPPAPRPSRASAPRRDEDFGAALREADRALEPEAKQTPARDKAEHADKSTAPAPDNNVAGNNAADNDADAPDNDAAGTDAPDAPAQGGSEGAETAAAAQATAPAAPNTPPQEAAPAAGAKPAQPAPPIADIAAQAAGTTPPAGTGQDQAQSAPQPSQAPQATQPAATQASAQTAQQAAVQGAAQAAQSPQTGQGAQATQAAQQASAQAASSGAAALAAATAGLEGKSGDKPAPGTEPRIGETQPAPAGMRPDAAAALAARRAATKPQDPLQAALNKLGIAARPDGAPAKADAAVDPTLAVQSASTTDTALARALPMQTAIQQAAPALPAAAIAMQIAAHARAGVSRFEIRLDPPELGRVDVRLDVGHDGTVTTRMVVERAETLDMLQRDARALERALNHAGLKTDDGALNFSLKGERFGGQGAAGGFGAETGSNPQGNGTAQTIEPLVAQQAAYSLHLAGGGGLDIRV